MASRELMVLNGFVNTYIFVAKFANMALRALEAVLVTNLLWKRVATIFHNVYFLQSLYQIFIWKLYVLPDCCVISSIKFKSVHIIQLFLQECLFSVQFSFQIIVPFHPETLCLSRFVICFFWNVYFLSCFLCHIKYLWKLMIFDRVVGKLVEENKVPEPESHKNQ